MILISAYCELMGVIHHASKITIMLKVPPGWRSGILTCANNPWHPFWWAHHAFKVIADKAAGVYKCECMQWEHTV
jgi:hypothetical protein